MDTQIVVAQPRLPEVAPTEQTQEEKLIAMWLHGRSLHTIRAYARDWKLFRSRVSAPLPAVTLVDLQAFSDHLHTLPLRPGSRHRVLAAVKSFFAYCARLGYLPFDVTVPLRLPAEKDTLNERILEEEQMGKLIEAASEGRNRLIVELLYVAGVRVSELTGLCWRDLKPRCQGGQITVYGKGRKTRTILIDDGELWGRLLAVRAEGAVDGDRVFVISASQVGRIVKGAAKKAGLSGHVSPHWLRHCHGSHALDHGAPLSLVQATLGHANVATTSRYLHARPSESSSSFLTKRAR